MPGLEQIDPRKIWKNYVIALTLIFALVSASHFAETFVGGDARTMSKDINVSGGQRMLSQRILYFATAYQHGGYQNPDLREGLATALEQFDRAHTALINHATAPALQDMYFASELGKHLDQDVRRFMLDARSILGAEHAERDRALQDMQSFAPNELLQKLDTLVHIYEDLAHQNVDLVENASIIGYALAILAICFEAIFIFRPSHQTIVKAFTQLEDAKLAIEDREKDAFSALEEAEEAWAEAEDARATIEKSQSLSQARMSNAGYELEAPLDALTAALKEVVRAGGGENAMAAAQSAAGFADVANRMRLHILGDSDWDENPTRQVREACNLTSILRIAVGIVSASRPEQSPIILAPPKEKVPVLVCDTLAVFRTIVHLLRDARDFDHTAEIRLAFDVEKHEHDAKVSMILSQNLNPEITKQRPDLGAADKRLSDVQIRATILDELVESLEGNATVLLKEDQRSVKLTFRTELQSHRTASSRNQARRTA